jgi:hypothetical protein
MLTKDEFLTDGQLCEILKVSPRTTLRWRRDGAGPRFIRAGRHRILYRAADVNTWLSTQTFTHRAAEAVSNLSHPKKEAAHFDGASAYDVSKPKRTPRSCQQAACI